jgi:hypothetical protein
MKRKYFFALIVGTVMIFLIIYVVLFRGTLPWQDQAPDGNVIPAPIFPVPNDADLGTTSRGSDGGGANETLSIDLERGSTIQAKDFTHDAAVLQDPPGSGYYHIGRYAGATGEAAKIPYIITYFSETDFFAVALLEEPIGAVRKKAEQELMRRLGITQNEMCELRYSLAVPDFVSPFYAGRDLRFSFCPGSVQIPE